ncbi:baeRF12 domain-containing protein [Acidisoma sp. 7E03]
MALHRRLLFVIADGERVRFVRPTQEDNTLHSFSRVRPEAGHPGAAHDAHERDKAKLPALVAAQLNEEVALYDDLVLVAPADSMNAIRHRLSQQAAAKIVGGVEKDLAQVPDQALWPHLHEWVRPVHRAPLL